MRFTKRTKEITILLILVFIMPFIIWWWLSPRYPCDGEYPIADHPYAPNFKTLEIKNHLLIGSNDQLDALFAKPGQDGLSWETAYVVENFKIDLFNEKYSLGIEISGTNRCLVLRNICIQGPYGITTGIKIESCENVNITGCGLFQVYKGLVVQDCSRINISGNKFWRNLFYDIQLTGLWFSRISGNEIWEGGFEDRVSIDLDHWGNNTLDPSNTLNGLPIYYYECLQDCLLTGVPTAAVVLFDCRNSNITGFLGSELRLGNCSNISIYENMFVNLNGGKIQVGNSINVTIKNNFMENATFGSIELRYSHNCTIFNNSIQNSIETGVKLLNSYNISILNNVIKNTGSYGISLLESTLIYIIGNSISHSYYWAIALERGSGKIIIKYNYFCSNNLKNSHGPSDIYIGSSIGGNTISENIEDERCAGNVPDYSDTTPEISGYPINAIITILLIISIVVIVRHIPKMADTKRRNHAI